MQCGIAAESFGEQEALAEVAVFGNEAVGIGGAGFGCRVDVGLRVDDLQRLLEQIERAITNPLHLDAFPAGHLRERREVQGYLECGAPGLGGRIGIGNGYGMHYVV